ncbi:unnamed protein product [Caenorhabditis bovis]|uniref:DUF19 domain-containing protein n=1 Tax=Caenorhabditis bovis TaxID=2654633 RepID=A0A8S1FFW2_9PELO|nr:unnamed protein product [Caenorhabditis bovis]
MNPAPSTMAVLLLLIIMPEPLATCRVEECAQWFQKTKEYESLKPTSSERYCQVLSTYLKCMNDTMTFCHGNLRFHSSELVMRRSWKELNCNSWQKVNTTESQHTNKCYFNPPTPNRKMKFCSFFGDPHLIRFNENFETCSENGARPLIDNRYFLVQVTNDNFRGDSLTTTINKITILIRRHNCTAALRYEASSDEQDLPRGFNVIDTGSIDSNELCLSGCRKNNIIPVAYALTDPTSFSKCFNKKIHVPIKVAEDRCHQIGVTHQFFQACVFDLMLTGDDYLVSLAQSVHSDYYRFNLHRHHHHHRHHLQKKSESNAYKCLTSTANECLTALLSDLNNMM